MVSLRHTFRCATRSLSFQRTAPDRNPTNSSQPSSPPLSPPFSTSPTPSRSHSSPNLPHPLQSTPSLPSIPAPPHDPSRIDFSSRHSSSTPTLPTPTNPLFRTISSQKLSRRSLGPSRRRMGRTASFADGSRVWASSGSSFLSPRSATDDALWSRLRPSRVDRIRRNRFSSYNCASDFEVCEADDLVDIDISMLCRLPDRGHVGGGEDVFGRRRGDFSGSLDNFWDAQKHGLLAGDQRQRTSDHPLSKGTASALSRWRRGGAGGRGAGRGAGRGGGGVVGGGTVVEEKKDDRGEEDEETLRSITKAIDSSKGRLRKSANMSRAFKAVIKSGEGWVRKSEIIQATMDSEDSKDPSMIILLDPGSCDSRTPHGEGVCTTSEESGSVEMLSSQGDGMSSASVGFSTSMTAKQCAATLETLLREMSCKVSRLPDTDRGPKDLVRLRAMRIPPGGKRMERKIKIVVTIREEDHIRTSVSFKRLGGLYSSRDSHIPLCTDIRDRFQREWPAVVEALYIRLPNTNQPTKRQTTK